MPTVHVAHPRCPGCGKALYKAFEVGKKVKVADPYRFCRNTPCKLSGPGGVAKPAGFARFEPPGPGPKAKPLPKAAPAAKEAKPVAAKPPVRRARPAVAAVPKPAGRAALGVFVENARSKLKSLLDQVATGKEKSAVGLVLAILTQETGNHDAANLLIDQHKLGELFGIEKFSTTSTQ